MCKLCEFASSGFREGAAQMLSNDLAMIAATKQQKPDSPSVFSNLSSSKLAKLKFDFAIFEPLNAFPNPANYYQSIEVDGEKLGMGWSSGGIRGIGFLPNGNVLLYLKATEKTPFKTDSHFRFFFLIELSASQLQITNSPPHFILRADDLKVSGTNLVTGKPAEHTFSFTFAHLANENSAMRPEAANQSAFYSQILKRRGKSTNEKFDESQRGDFERYLVTTPHFAPANFLMKLSTEAGFETRFAMQAAVPEFLAQHFGSLGKQR